MDRPTLMNAEHSISVRETYGSQAAAASTIEIGKEELMNLVDAAKLIPSNHSGKGCAHVASILRWIQKGSNGIHLGAVRCGGKWVTSREAIARFLQACTEAAMDELGTPAERCHAPDGRRFAAARADKELTALGV